MSNLYLPDGKPKSPLERLAIAAQAAELTQEQVDSLRLKFEGLMIEFDLTPAEIMWVLSSIHSVISEEEFNKRWK